MDADAPQRISLGSVASPASWQSCSAAALGAFTLHMGAIQQPLAFVRGQTFGLIDGDTAAARPAFGRFVWLAFGIERLGNSRAAFSTSRSACAAARLATFSARRRGAANHSTLPCARPALSSSASHSQQKIPPGCAALWWQLFSADFHQKSILRHGRLIYSCCTSGSRFTGSVVRFRHCL